MKLEMEDPLFDSKSVDFLDKSDVPELVWQLSPVTERKISLKPKIKMIDYMVLRQYFAGVLLMSIGLCAFFWDSYFWGLAHETNEHISPYEVVLIKGLVCVVLFLVISQLLDINVLKFNNRFNLSLDNEEVTDVKSLKLCLITSFTGAIAMTLQAVSIKYVSASTSHLMVSCNSIMILVSLPLCFNESFSNISKFDIYSTIILVLSVSILMLGQLTSETSSHQNIIGYIWSMASAIFITISLILLRELNKKLHYIYYWSYVSAGYIIVVALVYTISPSAVDITKVGVWDFTAILGASAWNTLFLLLVSLAHKYAKPSQLAPMWSLVVVLAIIKELISQHEDLTISVIIGGLFVLVAFGLPICARLFTEDPTMMARNQIQMFKRFSSF